MKKLTLVLIISMISFHNFAQKSDVADLINSLMQVDAIKKYKVFKNDYETLLTLLTENEKLKNKPELYNELRAVYNSTIKEYDGFLIQIKSDMTNILTIRDMVKNPKKYAQKYLNTFTSATSYYETNFLPIYKKVLNETGHSRALSPVLLKLGIEGFTLIVEHIKKRKQEKSESFNLELSQVNNSFCTPLKLKEWNEIVKYEPINETTNNKFQNDKNETYVPYATINDLKGNIVFSYVSQKKPVQTATMPFKHQQKSRDLTIGQLEENTDYSGDYFFSENQYPENTAFQIKIKNTAFSYIFAINSNDKCYNIYPFSKEWVDAYKMERDLSIGELPGKDDYTNETIIPSKNAQTGAENYIIISGQAKQEQLCIIISKAELNMQDVYKKLDAMSGSIYEKLNAVFTDNIISANEASLNISSGNISFDAQTNEKTILPLLFFINRQ